MGPLHTVQRMLQSKGKKKLEIRLSQVGESPKPGLVAYMLAQESARPVHVLGTVLTLLGGARGSLPGGTVLGGGHGIGQIPPQPG